MGARAAFYSGSCRCRCCWSRRCARASSYIEATDGDLSGDRLAPSTLALTPGDNLVTGTVIAGDVDYLTITVPVGFTLSQINLLSFVSVDDLGVHRDPGGLDLHAAARPART